MPGLEVRILVYILSSLAIWRLSSLLAREDGPLDCFEHLRTYIGQKAETEKNGLLRVAIDSLYRGILCMWCNSIWFSSIWSIFISTSFPDWILNTLSLSTMVIMIETIIKGRK